MTDQPLTPSPEPSPSASPVSPATNHSTPEPNQTTPTPQTHKLKAILLLLSFASLLTAAIGISVALTRPTTSPSSKPSSKTSTIASPTPSPTPEPTSWFQQQLINCYPDNCDSLLQTIGYNPSVFPPTVPYLELRTRVHGDFYNIGRNPHGLLELMYYSDQLPDYSYSVTISDDSSKNIPTDVGPYIKTEQDPLEHAVEEIIVDEKNIKIYLYQANCSGCIHTAYKLRGVVSKSIQGQQVFGQITESFLSLNYPDLADLKIKYDILQEEKNEALSTLNGNDLEIYAQKELLDAEFLSRGKELLATKPDLQEKINSLKQRLSEFFSDSTSEDSQDSSPSAGFL